MLTDFQISLVVPIKYWRFPRRYSPNVFELTEWNWRLSLSFMDRSQRDRGVDMGLMQLLHAGLHWLDVPECIVKYKLCMMICRCQDGTAPQYLTAHWTPVSETASWQHLRSAASHQLIVPSHRLVTYGGRVFAVAGPSACNSLPKRLRDPSNSSSVFGRAVETFVFSEYLCMRRIRGFGEDALYTPWVKKNKTPNS